MPKLTGIFEDLAGLDTLSLEEINNWLSEKEHVYILENFMGNRILYPQTIPFSKKDMEIDLAILCAYMHTNQELYYSPGLKRIIIPEKVEWRFPPLANLVFFFPEIFNLTEFVELAIKKDSGHVEIAGTIISPKSKQPITEVKINGQIVKLDAHGITYFETERNSNEVEMEKQVITAAGGKVGIIINQKEKVIKK